MLRLAFVDVAILRSKCVRASRFLRAIACAIAIGAPALAQSGSIIWWVSINGVVPPGGMPAPVADNGPGDFNLAPGDITAFVPAMTDGTFTLLAGTTVSGFKIPGVNGRNLTVTAIDGLANPGAFPPQAGHIDIHACYRFNGPGLTVPAPNVHTRLTFGTLENNVTGLINLAGVRYLAMRNGACNMDAGDPGAFALNGFGQVGPPLVQSPIPFFDVTVYPLSPFPCVDITTVTRLTVFRNGDEVILPGSAESTVVEVLSCNTGGSGGAIPAAGTGDGVFPGTLPSAPLIATLNAAPPGGATAVTGLRLNGLTHTFLGDLQVVLQEPGGPQHNIVCRPGNGGFGCDLNGDYTIVDTCNSGLALPGTCATNLPPATYEQSFGAWPSGTNSISNTPMSSIPASSGTWTLYVYDWAAADVGALTSWDLCFGNPVPTTGLPMLASPPDGATVHSQSPSLSWTAASCATSYDLDVDGAITSGIAGTTTPITVTPGLHTWRVRGVSGSTPGEWTAGQTFTFEPPLPCSELQTLFATNNGGSVGGQVFFDMNVNNPAGITLGEIGINTAAASSFSLSMYTRPGSYVGNTTSSGWTLLTSGSGVGAGTNLPSMVDVTDAAIPFGSWGVSLILTGADHRYTNGTGSNQSYANSDLSLSLGAALNVPWTGTPFSPRVWNGILRYDCTAGPVAYCTAGTSTNGCVPSISASAQPSASLANACTISISNVEGQKFGIIFYGVNQVGFTPVSWSPGSGSFLCVKPPTQRTGSTSSGGTANACNGSLSLDWNAFQSANPISLGNPFSAGGKVYVQGWYRDPPAPKTTNLSDALEMTMVP